MDTNVKGFRYSFINKFICIMLCLITLLAATGITSLCVFSCNYCEDGVPESFTDSSLFVDAVSYRIGFAMEEVYNQSNSDTYYTWENHGGWYNTYTSVRCYAVLEEINSYYNSGERLSEEEVYKHDIYFVYKDGRVTAKGISDKVCNTILERCMTDAVSKQIDVYLYAEIPESANIFEYIYDYDIIIGLSDFHDAAIKAYNNLNKYITSAVLLLIISFVTGFSYLLVAGRKNENSPAKSAFIDYVPLEIHLGVYIALGVGASLLLFSLLDGLGMSLLAVYVIVAYAAVIWCLLFEFCSSVARCAKAERKFYKSFLTYHIIMLIVFIIKKLLKLDVKIFKAIVKSVKRTNSRTKNVFGILSYKPTKFKRNVILIAILYVLCNLIAFLIIFAVYWWAYDCGETFPAFLSAVLILADAGANVYLFIKFLKYIQQLDIIIDTASRHGEITLDIEALPQSLKTLAESMKYTNSELQAAVEKAVRDERLKTELITNVSHDLKTPLTSIITYVDLLSKCDIQDEKAQEYIRVLDDKGAKLKRLIDDLIEASKVNSGNITVNLSSLNLYELCLQATVDAQKDFEKADLELIVRESNDIPTILADGPKSFRIMENLLSNARKYSAKHSRVYVNVYRENDMGVLEIKNISAQPLDISPDELTQRFVRGDKSRTKDGNGLGLSIAKELCRAQNGELEIIIDGDLFKARVKLPLAK